MSQTMQLCDVQYCHRLIVIENNVNVGEEASQTLHVQAHLRLCTQHIRIQMLTQVDLFGCLHALHF